MSLNININLFDKNIDSETGSILFHRKGFHGLPDKVLHGKGYTIELKNNEVVLFDIYNPSFIMLRLVDEAIATETT